MFIYTRKAAAGSPAAQVRRRKWLQFSPAHPHEVNKRRSKTRENFSVKPGPWLDFPCS